MKQLMYLFFGIAIVSAVLLAITIGYEDSQGEGVIHIDSYAWECEECQGGFSEYRHFAEHKCHDEELLTREQWALKKLAEDLDKYGVNYPKEPNKIWGQGDPDPNHIKYFGNDNLSRLCYVQTQMINKQAQLIRELGALNAKQHLKLGKSDIELFNRVRKLEDPNAFKENKTTGKP